MNQFKFPQDQTLYFRIRSKQELKGMIKSEAQAQGKRYHYFAITEHHHKYIYAKCNKCNAQIKYIRVLNDQFYTLRIFQSLHNHKKDRDDASQIQKWIKQLPGIISTSAKMYLTLKRFHIKKAKFYYHYRKIESQSENCFKKLIIKLDSNQYQTRTLPFPLQNIQIPNIFITSSPEMISLYKLYGKSIGFDITYNLIREKFKTNTGEVKKYGLGLFTGINNFNKIIIFALVILNDESVQTMYSVFKSFFEMMQSPPQTIITDQQISFASALKQLASQQYWSGNHLLDQFHIGRNLVKKTKNNELINYLMKACKAQNNNLFQECIEKARSHIQSDHDADIVTNFMKKAQMICFSQTKLRYCGPHITSNYNQKANDLIKRVLEYERPAVVACKKILSCIESINHNANNYQIQKIHYEDLFQNFNIKNIRPLFSKTIFNILLRKFILSLKFFANQIQTGWEVIGYQNQITYLLQYNQDKLQCSCGFIIKTGLLCEHIWVVIRKLNLNCYQFIDQRWKIQYQAKTLSLNNHQSNPSIINNLGRSKLTRRNR